MCFCVQIFIVCMVQSHFYTHVLSNTVCRTQIQVNVMNMLNSNISVAATAFSRATGKLCEHIAAIN